MATFGGAVALLGPTGGALVLYLGAELIIQPALPRFHQLPYALALVATVLALPQASRVSRGARDGGAPRGRPRDASLRGARGAPRRQPRGGAGLSDGAGRAERRREDDAAGRRLGSSSPGARRGPLERRRADRASTSSDRRARSRPHVPDRPALSRPHGARQRAGRGDVRGRSGRTGRATRRHAGEVIAWVGLQDKAGLVATRLSLGEQKRLELAVALGTSPRLLLLDELGGGLAPRDRDRSTGRASSSAAGGSP